MIGRYYCMKLRPIFKCHGGKAYSHPWIIDHFPHDYQLLSYKEPCIGGGSAFLNKQVSVIETINDIDPNIYNLYMQLKNNHQAFLARLAQIQYTENFFEWARDYEKSNDLESAVAEFCLRRMSRGGLKKSFSWSDRLRGGQPGDVNAFETFKLHYRAFKKC